MIGVEVMGAAALLLALGASAVQETPAPAPSDDIVVVGERIRRLRLVTKTDRKTGVQRCVVKRSSGDAAFDARICGATLDCAKTAKVWREMKACLMPHVDAYGREIAARRAAARGAPDRAVPDGR